MMVESSPVASSVGRPRKPRDKRTLAELLRERGVFSTAHGVEIALDICDALSIAHENGVIHGQLGLGCVRLAFSPEVGPRDVEIFTLAPDPDDSAALAGRTPPPPPPFIEPLRVGGAPSVVDVRSDVWALGALLHAMLVERVPRSSGVEVVAEGMPHSLAAIVEACLATDPEARPQTVEAVAESIATFATWPPDQFARIAARRDRRLSTERARQDLERRGLSSVPNVLDKLDEAALSRAQRTETAEISSVLHGTTTEAALARLMTVVHEGTDAARVEHAAKLPALVDFDDDDSDVLPTLALEEDVEDDEDPPGGVLPHVITSPLTMPTLAKSTLAVMVPAVAVVAAADAAPAMTNAPAMAMALGIGVAPAEPPAARSKARVFGSIALAAIAICLGAGLIGYIVSSHATALAVSPPASSPAAQSAPAASAAASAPEIPVFTPSSLPEAPAITPDSLPEAKP